MTHRHDDQPAAAHRHDHAHEGATAHEPGHTHDGDRGQGRADHGHAHGGGAAVGREWHEARLHEEDLVLDIGGDIGALVIETDARWSELEIEVSPLGDDARRTHTAVHERRIGEAHRYVAVFAALSAGDYRIWVDEPGLADRVTITGGEVSSLDWTAPTPPLPKAAPGSGEETGR